MIVAALALAVAGLSACSEDSNQPGPTGNGGSLNDAAAKGGQGQGGAGAGGTNVGGGGNAGSSTGGTAGSSATGGAAGNSGAAGTGGTAGTGGVAGNAGAAGTGGTSSASGVIVPLYTYPDDSTWDAICASKSAHPTVDVRAIINPDNGPGSSKDSLFVSGIAKLSNAGIVVLGYVATGYASKSEAEAHTEIDAYKSWYPGVTGIFFDEMQSAAGDESYYAALTQYAKTQGFSSTVGNPGTDVAESYVGTVDTIFIYETDGLPALSALGGWHSNHDRKNFGIIPYAVPTMDAVFVAGARPLVGYIYLTDDDLPNPWDSLPPYFDALVGALE
ncbi:MAG: spherulation-specific family 4 protein [Deltaproteobacteria bacterium]|nr:spherulation-specific family 4 protein [Deltaproteobacteria bacterium]